MVGEMVEWMGVKMAEHWGILTAVKRAALTVASMD